MCEPGFTQLYGIASADVEQDDNRCGGGVCFEQQARRS
jgi:hypothetical protein